MPFMRFVNGNVTTTSVNTQTSGDVTITPASTTGFPGSPQFTILNRRTAEILLVTAVNAGPTWTVTRAFGGTVAAAFLIGDNLDYSITREMLLSGFEAKLDEQNLAADTANAVITLTVPSGLAFMRNLKVRLQATATTDAYLMWRFNSDSSATYDNAFQYGGSSTSTSVFTGLTFGRCYCGNAGALPQIGADLNMDIGSADATDRIKTWSLHEFMRQSGGTYFTMNWTGRLNPSVQAAISTISFSVDSAQNGVWAAGTIRGGARLSLYGIP
jgi:hypothetical protein